LIVETTTGHMAQGFRCVLSLWFIVQIVLPFTAPLQTCDLLDLFGETHQRRTPVSPESSTTPPATEANSQANSFVSTLPVSTLRASTDLAVVCLAALCGPFMSTYGLSPSPLVYRMILRL
jgi:hypothetical protein